MAPKNEKRRNEILKVSFELFSTQPYDKVTFSRIAEGAGIKKSLLQHYFGRKNEIIETMLNELLQAAYSYMDTLTFEEKSDDPFQKVSDFNMLLFKSVQVDTRLRQFIMETVSQPETLDEWIESICSWLWGFLDHSQFRYLEIRRALYFSMGGSMHLFQHQDELGLDYVFICRTHIRSILSFLHYDNARIEEICQVTEKRVEGVRAEDFLEYSEKLIPWGGKE